MMKTVPNKNSVGVIQWRLWHWRRSSTPCQRRNYEYHFLIRRISHWIVSSLVSSARMKNHNLLWISGLWAEFLNQATRAWFKRMTPKGRVCHYHSFKQVRPVELRYSQPYNLPLYARLANSSPVKIMPETQTLAHCPAHSPNFFAHIDWFHTSSDFQCTVEKANNEAFLVISQGGTRVLIKGNPL